MKPSAALALASTNPATTLLLNLALRNKPDGAAGIDPSIHTGARNQDSLSSGTPSSMGRYETLIDETKDLIDALLPMLAQAWKVDDVLDIIPDNIRMRAWDCERRDHIKDKTEDDPRNWGVQFLKDLRAIPRHQGGDLAAFHRDLYEKVALHEDHPWCRLQDIKELKNEYMYPERKQAAAAEPEAEESSSTDSYFEELHEPETGRGSKRKRSQHEVYEARVQHKNRKLKPGRLRRNEDGSFRRHEKNRERSKSSYSNVSEEFEQPISSKMSHPSIRRSTSHVQDQSGRFFDHELTNQESTCMPTDLSPLPARRSTTFDSVTGGNTPLEVQKLRAELEVAEAELKAALIRSDLIAAMVRAQAERAQADVRVPDAEVSVEHEYLVDTHQIKHADSEYDVHESLEFDDVPLEFD